MDGQIQIIAAMKTKIKIYRMPLSRVFPKTHPRAGEPTMFLSAVYNALGVKEYSGFPLPSVIRFKFHTVRANYPLWRQRIREVQEGKAVLAVYEWSGKPYSSDGCKNLFVFGVSAVKDFIGELLKTEKYKDADPVIDSGIGVQELSPISNFGKIHNWMDVVIYGNDTCATIPVSTLATGDGLSFDDFRAWFKDYDLSRPMAIIHFTKFRY
jgi:hypothetical protein